MSEKGEIRCHECLFSADGIYNATYLCNYATLTGHCRTKIARRKGSDGVWRKVKTVETPEECTRFLPRKGHQQRKLQRDAKKPGTKCRATRRDWDKAQELWTAGASDQEIAKALGCAKSAVCIWRRKNALRSNVRPGGWNKKQYDWELARKLYDEGQSTARIAEALGCSKNAVYDWMDGEGLVRPSRQKGEGNGPA